MIEKARKLNLNISEITEIALKSFSFSAKEVDRDSIYRSYEALFGVMKPLLEEYGASIEIASIPIWGDEDYPLDYNKIVLYSDGTFYSETFDSTFKDIKKIEAEYFYTPKDILENLMDSLAKAATKRKERMRELEIVKRIVIAIGDTMEKGKVDKTKRKISKRRKSN